MVLRCQLHVLVLMWSAPQRHRLVFHLHSVHTASKQRMEMYAAQPGLNIANATETIPTIAAKGLEHVADDVHQVKDFASEQVKDMADLRKLSVPLKTIQHLQSWG